MEQGQGHGAAVGGWRDRESVSWRESLRVCAGRGSRKLAVYSLQPTHEEQVLEEQVADIICWWSAGVTSAVATKLAIAEFGDRCRPIYFAIDSAHSDNDRFKRQCEEWYGMEIEVARSNRFVDQFDVIKRERYVNGPGGAKCTKELKKAVRFRIENNNDYSHQVFGFEYSKKEINRALRFKQQYPDAKPIFPLIEKRMTKPEALHFLESADIERPAMYKLGYSNNNCIGCVKGGAGYWNKIRIDFPDAFARMSELERDVGRSCIKGKFLDELPPTAGRSVKEVLPDCGNFCEIEFADLEHPQLELMVENPELMRSAT